MNGKVTRETLSGMHRGEKRCFALESQKQLDTARAIAHNTGRVISGRFSVRSDYENRKFYIERLY